MKIYLFNHETGIYLGEDFADESAIRRGDCVFPSDATTLEPPAVEPGFVPLYNSTEQCWTVHTVKEVRARNKMNLVGVSKKE